MEEDLFNNMFLTINMKVKPEEQVQLKKFQDIKIIKVLIWEE